MSLEDVDFFEDATNRRLILKRDEFRCFYCLKSLDENNYAIEHVVSRPLGSNTYKNLVASCRQCNNRKSAGEADDYLRQIFRKGLLSKNELTARLEKLEQLKAGDLKPLWP